MRVGELTRRAGNPAVWSDVPPRLDRLPWSGWHLRVVLALAVTWLLDGLEGSLGGSLSGALKDPRSLGFSDAQLGVSSSIYLAGAVAGALVFGALADRYGRRRLFSLTLLLYVTATSMTGLTHGLWSFTLCRALTGAGIGGEYAAINSAVDELVPARVRGRVDLWINASFWIGIIAGSLLSTALLAHFREHPDMGWRLAFSAGVPLGVVVLWMRQFLPESPRWLLSRGDVAKAEETVVAIEQQVTAGRGALPAVDGKTPVAPQRPMVELPRRLFAKAYRGRTLLCLGLMTAQAFFYNSVFFSLTLVLLRFYGESAESVGASFVPIAIANFAGPALLAPLFDSAGRRRMGATTFALAGVILECSAVLFLLGRLSAPAQVALWAAAFVFGSAAASSAYLAVSELFPQEFRASTIAFFYAFGTLAGGVCGPLLFGHLLGSGSRRPLFVGYTVAAVAMLLAAAAQGRWGVAAERRTLEELAVGRTCDGELEAGAVAARMSA